MKPPTLESAVARLYLVFEKYPANPDMDFCDHCISKKEILELAATPLRSLSPELADDFTSSALFTLGSVADLKHFLPRLMELAALDSGFLSQMESLFGRLRHGEWMKWPAGEIAAVRELFHAFWLRQISDASEFSETAICAIAQAEDDLRPYLDTWLADDSLVAAYHLADFINDNLTPMVKKRRLGNPWWKEREAQELQVRAWLSSAAVKTKLETVAVANSDSPMAEKIMEAAQLLQVFR